MRSNRSQRGTEPLQQAAEPGHRADQQGLELRLGRQVFRPAVVDRRGEPEPGDDAAQGRARLPTDSESAIGTSGRRMASTTPGTPPPVPTSSTRSPGARKPDSDRLFDQVAA